MFSFSKKECEALALQMQALELNGDDERALVEGVFWNALDGLSEADRRLPQVAAALPMLKRGVGVHHSGLLPILKEVIEILFQEGLLKARRRPAPRARSAPPACPLRRSRPGLKVTAHGSPCFGARRDRVGL